MGQDLILDLDGEVIERLKRRASAQSNSLEQFLHEVLIETARISHPPAEECENPDSP
jgi:hypothetical protein